ncbi:ribulose-phosphate 3-epimerase [Alkalicoccobacillus porphyridii]|uniref:Ribulose-phosphate 3-epimerase n=1 Tax=Alkalicoccobacillus porphyridii TaxID=2597270 RepID=A0A553ZY71_9BACI|nr:ribulose-phosphate 3-epimerase [Alkalicoccobacillus porphyridii]TSB46365.1 ribulose-phosphate 3-epimerase [Alkalicoccobacillus porphyridii]
MIKIAPSILSADFAHLADEIRDIDQAGADYVHIDAMDGHFVPNLTIGPMIVKAIRPLTELTLDVHLMLSNPDLYIANFAEAGADIISVHVEACPHLHRTIQLIKEKGVKAGVVLNPATPVSSVLPILHEVDLVLQMSVNPGFGGQTFISSTLRNIKELADYRRTHYLNYEIEVDGGVNASTAVECVEAGATVLVAGSAVFGEKDRTQAIESIRPTLRK